jgi:predicted TIM-barrel fold metal-dependent hydrolase
MRKIIDCHIHQLDDSQVDWARELGYYKVCLMDYRPAVLAEAMRKHPDFVVALGWLPMDQDSPRQLAALEEFRAIGCRGFKICCSLGRYDDEKFYPVYAKAQEYQMPIFFHTGWLDQRLATTTYPTKARLLVDWYDVMTLDRIALDFPKLKMTAYHMGVTRPADAAVLMRNHANVFGDTCTNIDENFWSQIGGKGLGYTVLAKMVVGTDGMSTRETHKATIDRLQSFLDSVGASAALQDRVFYKTALRILGMDEELKKHFRAARGQWADIDIDRAMSGRCGLTGATDFVDMQGEPAAHGTAAWIAYDDQTLHMTFVCRDANIDKLAVSSVGPIGDIWQDDSVEIFLAPRPDGEYWHIAANAIGRAFLQRGRGSVTELDCPVRHKIGKDAWAVSMSIPFALLGERPAAGGRWGLNICRNKISPPSQMITWMEIASTFHDPSSFGYVEWEK